MADFTKPYKGYVGSYTQSGNQFYGKVMLRYDLVTFAGSSHKDVQSSFKDAVDDYLWCCDEAGRLPDPPSQ